MSTELVNGYNVTGNHATVGREYHVCDASGKVLHVAAGKRPAIEFAEGREPGDVRPEPEPTPRSAAEARPTQAAPGPRKKAKQ